MNTPSDQPGNESGNAPSPPNPDVTVLVVSGPGGVGKGTVVAELAARHAEVWVSRSWTTRDRRPGEGDDAYVFATRADFEARVAADGFLEWAEFLGNLYGTPTPEPTGGATVAVLEIEVQGAAQVRERIPGAMLVFIEAPSPEEHEARLQRRGDPAEKIAERIAVAAQERAAATDLGSTILVNEDIGTTADALWTLVTNSLAD